MEVMGFSKAQAPASCWSTEVTGSSKLPGPSGVQLQVGDVLLDPVLTGVGTDLPASLGLEAEERNGRVTQGRVQQGNPGPAVALHPTLCWAAQGLLQSQSRESH